ncbi:O-antigen ligase family protein [Pontiella sp.]|uniref:O-antigen ligase family protein n=1 Tax=Pontiella sp. TaxID=2837462 RepID=UPI00356ADDC6
MNEMNPRTRIWSLADGLFWLALILSPVQIFTVQTFGFYPSLAVLCAWMLFPFSLASIMRVRREHLGPILLLLCLLIAQAISLLWSNDLQLGIRTLLYECVFVSLFTYATAHPARIASRFEMYIVMFLVLAGAQAVLVILFRLSPALESAFWEQPIARIFINPNTLSEWSGEAKNNVWSVAKSGGFFNNANVGAIFCGVCYWFTRYFSTIKRSVAPRCASYLFVVSVCCSGSKFAIPLLVFFLSASLIVKRARRCSSIHLGTALLCLVALTATDARKDSLPPLAKVDERSFSERIGGTSSIRLEWWKMAGEVIASHPIKGAGFGGWEAYFSTNENPRKVHLSSYPPHNTYLHVWVQSGLMALVPVLVFLFLFLKASLRLWRTCRTALFLAFAAACCFVHSAITNCFFFGEEHIMPLMALSTALLFAGLPLPVERKLRDPSASLGIGPSEG